MVQILIYVAAHEPNGIVIQTPYKRNTMFESIIYLKKLYKIIQSSHENKLSIKLKIRVLATWPIFLFFSFLQKGHEKSPLKCWSFNIVLGTGLRELVEIYMKGIYMEFLTPKCHLCSPSGYAIKKKICHILSKKLCINIIKKNCRIFWWKCTSLHTIGLESLQ